MLTEVSKWFVWFSLMMLVVGYEDQFDCLTYVICCFLLLSVTGLAVSRHDARIVRPSLNSVAWIIFVLDLNSLSFYQNLSSVCCIINMLYVNVFSYVISASEAKWLACYAGGISK